MHPAFEVRVIYYFRDLNMPLVLLAVYPKNHIARLSAARMKEIGRKVDDIIQDYCGRSIDRRA